MVTTFTTVSFLSGLKTWSEDEAIEKVHVLGFFKDIELNSTVGVGPHLPHL